MNILAFESSCDETSASVVCAKEEEIVVLSNIIASQISVHALYGGVVPEIASRAHVEAISSITYEALEKANLNISQIDLIAVTNSPGLIGALLVGVNFAKALAFANNIPLIAIDHIKGHIAANYIEHPELKPPFIAFVASGGHTSIIKVNNYTDIETIGRTRDDAIGEAFDKVGRIMGLPYPGGKEMDRLASIGNKDFAKFPSGAIHDDSLDFSFSGLKTHIVNYLHTAEQRGQEISKEDVAAAFTKTVCESVKIKLKQAIEIHGISKLVVAGGVSANSHLRNMLTELANQTNSELYMPSISLCGDNAAMIAAQAYHEYKTGEFATTSLNAYATKVTKKIKN
ncbi:MAG: tRNA (adenosine(37)-N6)-threonylcarbamoyltransferase complex transferase subunit TsaD [Clostridia bacterium]|nr:tRNA (adenosine(37)-N6)-threonylcarbamoyltransferase complex transferase subunit TsaD [Clostridia bacterium]